MIMTMIMTMMICIMIFCMILDGYRSVAIVAMHRKSHYDIKIAPTLISAIVKWTDWVVCVVALQQFSDRERCFTKWKHMRSGRSERCRTRTRGGQVQVV